MFTKNSDQSALGRDHEIDLHLPEIHLISTHLASPLLFDNVILYYITYFYTRIAFVYLLANFAFTYGCSL